MNNVNNGLKKGDDIYGIKDLSIPGNAQNSSHLHNQQ